MNSYAQRTWALKRKDANEVLKTYLLTHSENSLFNLAPKLKRPHASSLSLHFSELPIRSDWTTS